MPVHPGDHPADSWGVPRAPFFREPYHCEVLARTVLPELARVRRRGLRLWAAGCASGAAAWSLAMVVQEARLPAPLEVSIVATDGEPQLLARASEAVYRDDEMRGVNAERRRRHFVRGLGPRTGLWRVIAELRDQVEFVELDLHGAWPDRGAFDVVLCHDSIAALDAGGATRLAQRFAGVLAPGGAMLLARGATMPAEVPGVVPVGGGVYRKPA
jgi:chemotaxis protein methyltransferase CheR